jgi:hypothetical protein
MDNTVIRVKTPQEIEFENFIQETLKKPIKNARVRADTGFGKTYTARQVAQDRAKEGKYTIIAFPNKELIIENFKMFPVGVAVQKLSADDNNPILATTRVILTTHEYLSFQKWTLHPYQCIKDVFDTIAELHKSSKGVIDLLVIIDEADIYYKNSVYSVPMGAQYYKQDGDMHFRRVADYFTNGIQYGDYVSRCLSVDVKDGLVTLEQKQQLLSLNDTSGLLKVIPFHLEETPFDCSTVGKVKYFKVDESKYDKSQKQWNDFDWRSLSSNKDNVIHFMQTLIENLPYMLDSCYVMKKTITDIKHNKEITYDEFLVERIKLNETINSSDPKERLGLIKKFNEDYEFHQFSLESAFIGYDLRFLKMLNELPFVKVIEMSAGYDSVSNNSRDIAFGISTHSKLFTPDRCLYRDFDGATFWKPNVNILFTTSPIKWHSSAPKRVAESFTKDSKATIGDIFTNTIGDLKCLIFQPLKKQTEKLQLGLKKGVCLTEHYGHYRYDEEEVAQNYVFHYSNGVYGRGVNNFMDFDVVFVPLSIVKPPHIFIAKDDKDLNAKIMNDVADVARQNIGRIIRNDPKAIQKHKWIVIYAVDQNIIEETMGNIKSMCQYPIFKEVTTDKKDKGISIVLKLIEEITGNKLPEVDEKQRVAKDWVEEYTKKINDMVATGLSFGVIRTKLHYSTSKNKDIIDSILLPLETQKLVDKIKKLKARGMTHRELKREIHFNRLPSDLKKLVETLI